MATMPAQTLSAERLDVNGVDTCVLTAGGGDPLVFLHGAGTFAGFDFATGWADRYRVIVPYHPGFGESADDPRVTEMHDYVLHYLELFDRLGLESVNLVGHSLGGWLAALLAVEHSHRILRLVLVSPAGLRVPEHPTADIFSIPPEQLPSRLTADPEVVRRLMPAEPDLDFLASRYRESSSLARVLWERNYDRKLGRWLHRVTKPTLIVWGAVDSLIPVEQAEIWRASIPDARVHVIEGCGHLPFHETRVAAAVVRDFLEGARRQEPGGRSGRG